VLLVATTVAEAQGGGGGRRGGGGGRGPGQIPALMQNITVEADIQAKIDSLTSAFTAASAKLRSDLGLPAQMGRGGRGGGGGGGGGDAVDPAKMQEFMTKNGELTTTLRNDVKALLTPDQQKTFDENLANLPQGRRGGRRGGGDA
jgi:Spy/CpxP family protein refolding chaperone